MHTIDFGNKISPQVKERCETILRETSQSLVDRLVMLSVRSALVANDKEAADALLSVYVRSKVKQHYLASKPSLSQFDMAGLDMH